LTKKKIWRGVGKGLPKTKGGVSNCKKKKIFYTKNAFVKKGGPSEKTKSQKPPYLAKSIRGK